MRLTIKSRVLEETFEFWMHDNGGYVYLETDGRPASTGHQICYGGDLLGDTITATPYSFKDTCRKWYRQRVVWMSKA